MMKGLQGAVFALAIASVTYAQTPTVPDGSILNAASYDRTQAVAPGSLVSIFGSNLASTTQTASSIPLATAMADVSVTFNGVAAPLLAVIHGDSFDQLNVQVPWDVLASLPPGTAGSAQVVVKRGNASSAGTKLSLTNAAPGIFTVTGTGAGQAVAYGNTDFAFAAPSGSIPGVAAHPAKVNDPTTLVILATGLGPVDTTVKNGDVPSVITSNTTTKPTVLVGGKEAQVVFSGMVGRDSSGKAFGFVGVYQLNIIIAPGTPTGDAVSLQIQMNGVTSTDKVTIAVSN
jgi:uncharacterized protein (TIGR03437 family)